MLNDYTALLQVTAQFLSVMLRSAHTTKTVLIHPIHI